MTGDLVVPPEAYEAAARNYDEAIGVELGNIAGSVLGDGGVRSLAAHRGFRAAVERARADGVAEGRRQAAADMRAWMAGGARLPDHIHEGPPERVSAILLGWAARIAEGNTDA